MSVPMPPSDHEHLGDLLSGLLDRELSVEEELAARQHLDECGACSTELESVRLARSWVRSLPAVEPPFGFLESIVFGPPSRPSWRERLDWPVISFGPRRPATAFGPRRPATAFGPRRPAANPSFRRRAGVAALTVSAAAAVALVGIAPPRDAPVAPPVARLVEAHATGASVEGDPLSRLAPLGVPVSFGR
jgi:hypothetical protein